MREYLPILIVGAIIGVFTILFLTVYTIDAKRKKAKEFERNMTDSEIVTRLLRYAGPYKKQFVVIFFIMLFSITFDLISPLIIGELIEMVQGDFELTRLYTMVITYAVILVVSVLCTFVQAMMLQKIGQKILSAIRLDVFTHIEGLSH